MLPGFRFLFAAIVLSMSLLTFGLGAAALLRASHEQFASIPSRRSLPEPVFPRQNEEAPTPTLALLRVEPDVADKLPDNATAPIAETETPAAQAPEAPPTEPEKLAALKLDEAVKPDEAVPAETVKAELPAAEAMPAVQPATSEIPAAATATTAAEAPAAETPALARPAASEEVKLAAVAEAPPPATSGPSAETAPVQMLSLEGNIAATRIATLGGPAVAITETVSTKPAAAKPDRSVNRKRAQRAKERRRIAAARRALQARQVAQQAADPFAQLTRGR